MCIAQTNHYFRKGDIEMKLNRNLGMILLAVYLILVGLEGLFGFSLGGLSILGPICALAAGVLILLNR